MAGMTPVGDLEVAADLTTAALIDNPLTESQASVDRRVRGVAVDIIASDPTIKEGAAAAAEQAANNLNSVRAYPETAVLPTSQKQLPMQWVYRELRDPYADAYTDTYDGTWVGSLTRSGELPVLGVNGRLDRQQIPEEFTDQATVSELIAAALAGSQPVSAAQQREISSQFPIFAARVAQARAQGLPLAFVITGSSTSARAPGYVVALTSKQQEAFLLPAGQPYTAAQFNTDAQFTEHVVPGMHIYSAAIGGARSGNYLNNAQRERIAALRPALIHHMIGANDFRDQAAVATYKANVIASLTHFDSILTAPCQHVLWHPYQSLDVASPTIPWAAYGEALEEIAADRPDTVFVDISAPFIANLVPGGDPLDLVSTDKVHLSATGYDFMTDLMAQTYLS